MSYCFLLRTTPYLKSFLEQCEPTEALSKSYSPMLHRYDEAFSGNQLHQFFMMVTATVFKILETNFMLSHLIAQEDVTAAMKASIFYNTDTTYNPEA
jgi:hypothetical protein